jgi:hypothetical protein
VSDETIRFPNAPAKHGFHVVKEKINIFTDVSRPDVVEGIEDDQKVVYISIGPGETRVNVLDDEGRSLSSWTAVFGWSSLCDIEIRHGGDSLCMATLPMITKALRSSLRLYGQDVDTADFIGSARGHLHGALSHIIDQTIGDAREYDRIILAAPVWLHEVLKKCVEIRPHIDPVIQEL